VWTVEVLDALVAAELEGLPEELLARFERVAELTQFAELGGGSDYFRIRTLNRINELQARRGWFGRVVTTLGLFS